MPEHEAAGEAALSGLRTGELGDLTLEQGARMRAVQVAYRTWGRLAPGGDNAVLVCHALTGSADVEAWWPGVLGAGLALDPRRDFVVCSNVLGGCYGTTGPRSWDPSTGRPYGARFPAITIRDMVQVQARLLASLGVRRLRLVVGGSLGGMQALEWACSYPDRVDGLVVFATAARHPAFCIALDEAQRQAIYADPNWRGGAYPTGSPPTAGLAAARMMAMCTYRSAMSFEDRFGRRLQGDGLFAVESYLRHQGRKLVDRFDAGSYVTLTRAMDSHDVTRDRGSLAAVLGAYRGRALVVAIDSDLLYGLEEHRELAALLGDGRLVALHTPHGHDGFLVETDAVNRLMLEFFGDYGQSTSSVKLPAEPP